MFDPLGRPGHVSALSQRQRLPGRSKHHVTAHPGGQVQHHIDLCGANALGHLPVQHQIPAGGAGVRVAHMTMHHRRLRPCVAADPVTAQVMNTPRFILSGIFVPSHVFGQYSILRYR